MLFKIKIIKYNKMLIISSWLGRIGQEIVQLLRTIHIAKQLGHTIIRFPYQTQNMLNSTEICLDDSKPDNPQIIKNQFFYITKLGFKDPPPYIMKQYFQQYIRPIFKLNFKEGVNENVLIHIRSEDMYRTSSPPHPRYLPTPLVYYEYIIDKYYSDKKIIIIAADRKDPCINILCQRPNVEFFSNGSLQEDLEQFTNVKHFVMSTGLLDFLMYLFNDKLETMFMPDYTYHELVQGSYGNNINLHIVKIPDYIKLGEWKYTLEQFKTITDYKLPEQVEEIIL
jgi:hypothetical protein